MALWSRWIPAGVISARLLKLKLNPTRGAGPNPAFLLARVTHRPSVKYRINIPILAVLISGTPPFSVSTECGVTETMASQVLPCPLSWPWCGVLPNKYQETGLGQLLPGRSRIRPSHAYTGILLSFICTPYSVPHNWYSVAASCRLLF